jgi:hypothetical protein
MREKLSRRLVHLEEIHAAALLAKGAAAEPSRDVTEMIRQHLSARGYVQTGNESLAETLGRAFGMNNHELRQLIAGPVEAFNARLHSL